VHGCQITNYIWTAAPGTQCNVLYEHSTPVLLAVVVTVTCCAYFSNSSPQLFELVFMKPKHRYTDRPTERGKGNGSRQTTILLLCDD
jgi:hypothetical protein